LQEKIVDLDVASDNAWEDLKNGAENSWKALSQAFDKAASHFKK
jgi:biotin synthase-related radical SAM superfamily protein